MRYPGDTTRVRSTEPYLRSGRPARRHRRFPGPTLKDSRRTRHPTALHPGTTGEDPQAAPCRPQKMFVPSGHAHVQPAGLVTLHAAHPRRADFRFHQDNVVRRVLTIRKQGRQLDARTVPSLIRPGKLGGPRPRRRVAICRIRSCPSSSPVSGARLFFCSCGGVD